MFGPAPSFEASCVMQACARCNQPGKYRCSGCNSVCYCSAACQKESWARGHKGQCAVLKQLATNAPSALKRSSEGLRLVPNVPVDQWLAKPDRVGLLVECDREAQHFPGCGIENVGNTCFVNSVLQVLTSSVPLLLWLQSKEHSLACGSKGGFCSLCAMSEWAVLVSGTSSEYFVRPMQILRHLSSFGDFRLGMQSDAAEFFYGLVNSMQTALIGNRKLTLDEEHTTLISQLFGGFKCHQLCCVKCKTMTALKAFEYFLDLPLPSSSGKMSVEELLLEFFGEAKVEGWKSCPQCKETSDGAVESSCLYRTHSLLGITLMRFDERGRKIHAPVAFRMEMNLKHLFHPDAIPQQEIFDYDLYGLIVHYGESRHAGHYTAFVKMEHRWYLCDDLKITEVAPGVVMSQAAYMLFYQRRQKGAVAVTLEYVAAPQQPVAKKEAAVAPPHSVHFRTGSDGASIRDLVVRVEIAGVDASSVRITVKESGFVRIGGASFAEVVVADLPFTFKGSEARAKVYEKGIVVTLPICDVAASQTEGVSVPVAACSGPVQEVVLAENCIREAEPARAASGASQGSDWLSEASYRALYQMIAEKPVAAVVKPAVSAVKVAPKVPKRNDPCFCGSGRKFKSCHMK